MVGALQTDPVQWRQWPVYAPHLAWQQETKDLRTPLGHWHLPDGLSPPGNEAHQTWFVVPLDYTGYIRAPYLFFGGMGWRHIDFIPKITRFSIITPHWWWKYGVETLMCIVKTPTDFPRQYPPWSTITSPDLSLYLSLNTRLTGGQGDSLLEAIPTGLIWQSCSWRLTITGVLDSFSIEITPFVFFFPGGFYSGFNMHIILPILRRDR